MTISTAAPVLDRHGRAMFACIRCGAPITHDDFFELGLRLPHPDEDRDDYTEAELIDDLTHIAYASAQRAG